MRLLTPDIVTPYKDWKILPWCQSSAPVERHDDRQYPSEDLKDAF